MLRPAPPKKMMTYSLKLTARPRKCAIPKGNFVFHPHPLNFQGLCWFQGGYFSGRPVKFTLSLQFSSWSDPARPHGKSYYDKMHARLCEVNGQKNRNTNPQVKHSDETFVFCAWLATGYMRPELNEINIAIWLEESY